MAERPQVPPTEYQEGSFPGSPRVGGLSRANREWLADSTNTLDDVVTVERLRRKHPEEFTLLAAACQDRNRRPVLAGVCHHDGVATYDDLAAYATCSRRTVREHVYALRDAGVLEVQDGRPSTVGYASETLDLLAEDTLSVFYGLE